MRYPFLKYVLIGVCCCSVAFAQEQEKKRELPGRAYKVDVLLTETEGGKAVNSRTYTMLINDQEAGRIRQGDRIPVNVGSVPGKEGSIPSQIQYMDVGFSLDCRVAQKTDGLYMSTVLDMSSLAPEP